MRAAAQEAVAPSEPVTTPSVAISTATAETEARRAFGTRHAHFSPTEWHALPGWIEDDHVPALRAFLQSCHALGRKPSWNAPCRRAAGLVGDRDGARNFFESEFILYEIRNADRSPEGVITGYYEPLLAGSATRQARFVHPVYGAPTDMLTLDIRLWPKPLRQRAIGARLEGRRVIPVIDGAAPYVLDVGELVPDDRRKLLRLRLDGQRLVPYFTRAEIERQGLAQAPVLAWVDDPVALYSMQIQGSGKIRLVDGRTLRLAYAEQNGHPFTPPVRTAKTATGRGRLLTRGLDLGLTEDEEEALDAADESLPVTRGGRRGAAPNAALGSTDADVEQMIRQLLGVGSAEARPPTAGASRRSRPAPIGAAGGPVPQAAPERVAVPERPVRTEAIAASLPLALPGAQRASTAPVVAAQAISGSVASEPMASAPAAAAPLAISTDPSFVFFRLIPDGPDGPIGALGVPLTAGRSVAVDPRTTPLGSPVFLSSTHPTQKAPINRLVMAQDTGGAIRGAVRADYFWGFGAQASTLAARMKEGGRMWLLMPKAQEVAARDNATLTRGPGDASAAPECVVEDPELCVEDQ